VLQSASGAAAKRAPARPEQEGAEHRERRRVPPEVGVQRAGLEEAARARPERRGREQRREAADEVHHGAAREVDGADAEQRRAPRGAEPAVRVPHPAARARAQSAVHTLPLFADLRSF
jgi:hypothetical protein